MREGRQKRIGNYRRLKPLDLDMGSMAHESRSQGLPTRGEGTCGVSPTRLMTPGNYTSVPVDVGARTGLLECLVGPRKVGVGTRRVEGCGVYWVGPRDLDENETVSVLDPTTVGPVTPTHVSGGYFVGHSGCLGTPSPDLHTLVLKFVPTVGL